MCCVLFFFAITTAISSHLLAIPYIFFSSTKTKTKTIFTHTHKNPYILHQRKLIQQVITSPKPSFLTTTNISTSPSSITNTPRTTSAHHHRHQIRSQRTTQQFHCVYQPLSTKTAPQYHQYPLQIRFSDHDIILQPHVRIPTPPPPRNRSKKPINRQFETKPKIPSQQRKSKSEGP